MFTDTRECWSVRNKDRRKRIVGPTAQTFLVAGVVSKGREEEAEAREIVV